jgi:hypothetical protein
MNSRACRARSALSVQVLRQIASSVERPGATTVDEKLSNVTLRRAWKARGFFRLSSVVDERRNEAWLRLGAHRSGGGKARNQSLHSGVLIAGRCHARSGFHASHKGMNGPQLVVGVLESRTKDHPRLFRGSVLGNMPTRLEAFPERYSWKDVTLPKAVDWVPVPSHVEIAHTLGNTGVFLPPALRWRTRTLFSSQGTDASIAY